MAIPAWRKLTPTSEAQRRALAKIGPADLTQAERFVASFDRGGTTADLAGRTVSIPAREAKQLILPLKNGKFRYDTAEAAFRNVATGRILPEATVKAGAESVVANAQAVMARVDRQLRAAETVVDEWETTMINAIKMSRIAQAGLAYGGIENIPASAIARIEDDVFININGTPNWTPGKNAKGEFPGLHRFAEGIEAGRYGTDQLSNAATSRTLSYAQGSRCTYENELLNARQDAGHGEGCRLMAAVEHCFDCIAWAALGWMPIAELLAQYPIGASVCGARCYCVIVTRRTGAPEAAGVRAAIENARQVAAQSEMIRAGRMNQ